MFNIKITNVIQGVADIGFGAILDSDIAAISLDRGDQGQFPPLNIKPRKEILEAFYGFKPTKSTLRESRKHFTTLMHQRKVLANVKEMKR